MGCATSSDSSTATSAINDDEPDNYDDSDNYDDADEASDDEPGGDGESADVPDNTSFDIDDCVTINVYDDGSGELVPIDCADAVQSLDPNGRGYRVNDILPVGSGCAQLQGFFPVEFLDLNDEVVYCLVQV